MNDTNANVEQSTTHHEVYEVYVNDCEETHILGIFSTREKAEKFHDEKKAFYGAHIDGIYICTHVLDEPNPELERELLGMMEYRTKRNETRIRAVPAPHAFPGEYLP